MESPFTLAHDVESSFEACSTLRAVRDHLSTSEDTEYDTKSKEHSQIETLLTLLTSFCDDHSDLSEELVFKHLLHRDILHALIVPVVALYSRTATLASAAVCSTRPSDLELAYRGDARSAFLFMQCFVHENEEWCYSRACPACITHHTLSDEAPLRLAVTAALMADAAPASREGTQPAPLGRFIDAIQQAVANDPFWGSRNWSYILSKATALQAGFKDLVSQASELETLVLSPPRGTSPTSTSASSSAAASKQPTTSTPSTSAIFNELLASPTRPSTPGPQYKDFPTTEAEFKRAIAKLSRYVSAAEQQALPNLRPSALAKQQLRMDREQRALMHRQAWQIHSAVSMPAAEILAMRRGRRRYRDEDLWEVESGRSRSMTT